jgi:uncharacterized protein (DUF433 family)
MERADVTWGEDFFGGRDRPGFCRMRAIALQISIGYVQGMQDIDYPLPDPLVSVSPDRLGGEPCFAGRRVPVKALFDYLKADHSLDEFLEDYPSVSRAHVVAVLDLATETVTRAVAAE